MTRRTILTLATLAVLAAHATAGGGREAADRMPLVEPAPVAVTEEQLRSVPFREGLPASTLPAEAGEISLDPDSVVRHTTACGLRTIWGRYDDAIVMVWKAPELADAESGVLGVGQKIAPDPERVGPQKAAITIGQLHDGTTPAGQFYPAEQVVASDSDADGIVWFATEGEQMKYWVEQMHPAEHRCSFWWRSGLWIVGVDAPTPEQLEAIVADVAAALAEG